MERDNLARFLAESAAEVLESGDGDIDVRRQEAAELMNLGLKIVTRSEVADLAPVREAA